MEPEELARPNTEHAHQMAFFCWINQQHKNPDLKFAFAIPNGGQRHIAVASKLKAEGQKKGVPDVFIPIPIGQYHGLWIEFKRPADEGKPKGKPTKEQLEWERYLKSKKYGHFYAFTWLQAVQVVLEYINQPTR